MNEERSYQQISVSIVLDHSIMQIVQSSTGENQRNQLHRRFIAITDQAFVIQIINQSTDTDGRRTASEGTSSLL